jgi:hypothetical protein
VIKTRILTVDGGAILGFAHGDPLGNGGPPISGTHRLPSIETTGMMLAVMEWVYDIVKGNEIAEVWMEKSIIPEKTSYEAVAKLAGYNIAAGMGAARAGAKFFLVDMQTWRSALGLPTQGPKNVLSHPDYAYLAKTEKGVLRKDALKLAKRKWVKDRASDFARKNGSDPKDDNEGDAICIYHYVVQKKQLAADKTKYDLFGDLTV